MTASLSDEIRTAFAQVAERQRIRAVCDAAIATCDRILVRLDEIILERREEQRIEALMAGMEGW